MIRVHAAVEKNTRNVAWNNGYEFLEDGVMLSLIDVMISTGCTEKNTLSVHPWRHIKTI